MVSLSFELILRVGCAVGPFFAPHDARIFFSRPLKSRFREASFWRCNDARSISTTRFFSLLNEFKLTNFWRCDKIDAAIVSERKKAAEHQTCRISSNVNFVWAFFESTPESVMILDEG